MAPNKLSFADHAWLRMESPDNLMVITGLMTFDTPLDYERLQTTVERMLKHYPRFQQRLVQPRLPFARPYWEDDPQFNLEAHLERVSLPETADQKTLQDLISLVMSLELQPSRPLWQFYVIENYAAGGALVSRMHHSLADGIALMQVLLSLTTTEANDARQDAHAWLQETIRQAETRVNRHNGSPRGNGRGRLKAFRKGVSKLLPGQGSALQAARLSADLVVALGRMALRPPDPPTLFKGPLGEQKRAAWSQLIELRAVKEIGKVCEATVNDVLLTAVAGALGRYLRAHGELSRDLNIRGFIPVNLRQAEANGDLGNQFGLVMLSLPVGITNPLARLYELKENMDTLKNSKEAVAAFEFLNFMGAVPDRFQEIAVEFFDAKGTTIMTNVPGPQEQLYLAGAPVNTIMGWVPQTGKISFGVSIISYNGKVCVGIATDQGLVPDPENVIAFFEEEFLAMQAQAKIVAETASPDNLDG